MKKILIFTLVFTISFMFVDGQNKIFIEATGNFLFPSDSGYKDVYGSSLFYPGFEAGFKIVNNIYVFTGLEMLSAKGETPVLKVEAKSTQTIISAGAGLIGKMSGKMDYRVELGASSFSYKEEAFDEEVTGSKIGFLLKCGLTYDLFDRFYLGVFLGYNSASDSVDGVDIKLGGFKTSIGAGVKF